MKNLYFFENGVAGAKPPTGTRGGSPSNIAPFPGERLCMLGWLCIVQSLWAYTPGVRAGAECGAAALTKQGRLQSVAHSRCTTQRHQRLTTRIGATPKARTLWLLAKSFARCKTSKASNTKPPLIKLVLFQKCYA